MGVVQWCYKLMNTAPSQYLICFFLALLVKKYLDSLRMISEKLFTLIYANKIVKLLFIITVIKLTVTQVNIIE